jgi:hypothetical protein
MRGDAGEDTFLWTALIFVCEDHGFFPWENRDAARPAPFAMSLLNQHLDPARGWIMLNVFHLKLADFRSPQACGLEESNQGVPVGGLEITIAFHRHA